MAKQSFNYQQFKYISPRIIAKQPGIYILNTTIDNPELVIQKTPSKS